MLTEFREFGFKNFFKRAFWGFMALLFIATGLGFGVYSFIQATHQKSSQSQQPPTLKGTKMSGFTPVSSVPSLQTTDQTVGTGKEAADGSTVKVDYIGAVASTGIIFDTSLDSGQAATFTLKSGPGGVIEGFAKGIVGMMVGGTRQILIPAALGFGANPPAGSGIPPNADLVFSVTLKDVQ